MLNASFFAVVLSNKCENAPCWIFNGWHSFSQVYCLLNKLCMYIKISFVESMQKRCTPQCMWCWKKMQLYLCIFLFYLNIGLNGHILARCNLILMDLGESGPQDFSAVRKSVVFTVLGWQLHLLGMNINSPLSITVFRIFPLFCCPDVSHVISRWTEQQWFDMLSSWLGAPVWVGCDEAICVDAAEPLLSSSVVFSHSNEELLKQHTCACLGVCVCRAELSPLDLKYALGRGSNMCKKLWWHWKRVWPLNIFLQWGENSANFLLIRMREM